MNNYSTPLADLIARLDYHTKTKQTPVRRLDGYKWDPIPIAQVEGISDCPSIKIFIPKIEANFKPVRKEMGTMEFSLIVATKRAGGLVGLIRAVEAVIEALRFNVTDQAQAALAGTTIPFSWKLESEFAVDISLNAQITIAIETRPVEFAGRH